MGWTGNSSANWEMGWEMGYFKTIPGKGWEMGRVKMGEHCCPLTVARLRHIFLTSNLSDVTVCTLIWPVMPHPRLTWNA